MSITSLQELTTHLEQQLKQLSVLQDEIGYSENEKNTKTASFLESVSQFAQSQVDVMLKVKQELINKAETAQKSTLSYKKLMGEFASNKAVLDPNKSLQVNLQDLIKEQAEVKERYDKRLTHVKELYMQLEEFKSSMGSFVNTSMLMSSDEVDVSSLAVNVLEEEIQRCEIEYVNRKTTIEEGVKQISGLLVILGLVPESTQDKLIDQYYHEKEPENLMILCNQLVSEENMRYISIRITELQDMKQEVEFRKEEITQNLKHLWSRLHIDSRECEVFLMENRGLTQHELQQYEQELSRLLVLKQERVGDFIYTAREELQGLWNQLYYSETQKKQFQPAFTEELSDTILEAHENEISRLQLELEDSKYILERIEKHMKLKQEIEEFEATTKDPNRLFSNKGQRDPGRLLREEKFRKRISRELPKVRKELEGSLLEYEALKGHPFLVYGKNYYKVISEEENIDVDNNEKPTSRHISSSQQQDEKHQPLPVAPRTPKREILSRKPMTSPRPNKMVKRIFNTPQPHRFKSLNLTSTTTTATATMPSLVKFDQSESILHKVRERNIKKKHKEQKVIKRGHLFDDDESDSDSNESDINDENTAPPPPIVVKQRHQAARKQRLPVIGSQSESDDGLDLGIFDDGPDLSDMSEIDA